LDEALADFIAVLGTLNNELNGPVPSGPAGPPGARATVVPRDAAYAVAEVTRMLREYGERQSDAAAVRAAWVVDTAWAAVLAGDIDDLEEHVSDEERARKRRPPG
jgi:hypothetical protein